MRECNAKTFSIFAVSCFFSCTVAAGSWLRGRQLRPDLGTRHRSLVNTPEQVHIQHDRRSKSLRIDEPVGRFSLILTVPTLAHQNMPDAMT